MLKNNYYKLLPTFLLAISLSGHAQSKPNSQHANDIILDMVINNKITTRLEKDPVLAKFKLTVNTVNGIVTLTGNVPEERTASTTIEMIQAINGVNVVDASHLSINNVPLTHNDMVITARIRGIITRERSINNQIPLNLIIQTVNGIVSLSGNAVSKEQVDNVVALIKTVTGVKGVDSRLKILG